MTAAASDRPNILLLLTDQQSAGMLGCADNGHVETPAMDSLANAGVRFDRAYCTNPVCAPARVSLMTGRYPSAIGLRSNDASHLAATPDELTGPGVGDQLQSVGYTTVHGGKFGVPTVTPSDIGLEQLTANRRDGLAQTCAEFIRDDPPEPFFLTASFINPHDICYMAIRAYEAVADEWTGPGTSDDALAAALEPPDEVTDPAAVETYCPPLPSNHEPQTGEPGAIADLLATRPFRQYVREHWSEADWRRHRWAYGRLTERVDRQIGRVLTALETAGLREDTVVICTSDHGDHDGAHRLEHKTLPYEEAARVPLLIEPPHASGTPQVDADHLVSNGLDLLPTIFDYADVDPEQDRPGVSLQPLIRDESPPEWRDHLRIEFELGEAIVTDRYKYVRYDQGDRAEQLYDLDTDPGETRNAADEAEHRDRFVDLRARLVAESPWR